MNPGEGGNGRTITTLASREVYRNPGCVCARMRFCAPMGKRESMAWWTRTTAPSFCHRPGARVAGGAVPLHHPGAGAGAAAGGWEMEVENPEELARGELKEEMAWKPPR